MSELHTLTTKPRPRSLADLFWSFTILAMQGFGGVVAIVQRELVEKKAWLTPEEFVEDWAVAQIMPGPNVVNLAMMIGNRFFGLAGAMCALAGMLCFPLILVLLAVLVYGQIAQHPGVAGALRGMSAVAAGMIMASGLRLLPVLKTHPLGFILASAVACFSFFAIAVLRAPLVWVLLPLGTIAVVMVYRQLRRLEEGR